jgi:hypothetical protein
VSLLNVPYNNPQSDVYTTDFRVINGEVIYTVNIGNYKYFALLDTGSNVSIIQAIFTTRYKRGCNCLGRSKIITGRTKYTTIQCECLAIIDGLREFEPYITGRFVKMLTDHAVLNLISTKKKQPPGRLAIWLTYLQSFSFQVEHRLGSNFLMRTLLVDNYKLLILMPLLKTIANPPHLVIDSHTLQTLRRSPIPTEIDNF